MWNHGIFKWDSYLSLWTILKNFWKFSCSCFTTNVALVGSDSYGHNSWFVALNIWKKWGSNRVDNKTKGGEWEKKTNPQLLKRKREKFVGASKGLEEKKPILKAC